MFPRFIKTLKICLGILLIAACALFVTYEMFLTEESQLNKPRLRLKHRKQQTFDNSDFRLREPSAKYHALMKHRLVSKLEGNDVLSWSNMIEVSGRKGHASPKKHVHERHRVSNDVKNSNKNPPAALNAKKQDETDGV